MKNFLSLRIAQLMLLGAIVGLAGCSTDENPITPEKMSELRKQEGDQRANYRPDMSQPKGP